MVRIHLGPWIDCSSSYHAVMTDVRHPNPQTPADIQLAGLSLWVPDQVPRNGWLTVTAACEAPGAQVIVAGRILERESLAHFIQSAQQMYDQLEGVAELPMVEPNLCVLLQAKATGSVQMRVEITPDHLSQQHAFLFEIDQTYLPPFLTQARAVLSRI